MRSTHSFSIGINAHANPTISGILVSLLTTRGRAFRKKRQLMGLPPVVVFEKYASKLFGISWISICD